MLCKNPKNSRAIVDFLYKIGGKEHRMEESIIPSCSRDVSRGFVRRSLEEAVKILLKTCLGEFDLFLWVWCDLAQTEFSYARTNTHSTTIGSEHCILPSRTRVVMSCGLPESMPIFVRHIQGLIWWIMKIVTIKILVRNDEGTHLPLYTAFVMLCCILGVLVFMIGCLSATGILPWRGSCWVPFPSLSDPDLDDDECLLFTDDDEKEEDKDEEDDDDEDEEASADPPVRDVFVGTTFLARGTTGCFWNGPVPIISDIDDFEAVLALRAWILNGCFWFFFLWVYAMLTGALGLWVWCRRSFGLRKHLLWPSWVLISRSVSVSQVLLIYWNLEYLCSQNSIFNSLCCSIRQRPRACWSTHWYWWGWWIVSGGE